MFTHILYDSLERQKKKKTMPIRKLWYPYSTQYTFITLFNLGEFGVVYKANFIGYNNGCGSVSVAVKTMQGSYVEFCHHCL